MGPCFYVHLPCQVFAGEPTGLAASLLSELWAVSVHVCYGPSHPSLRAAVPRLGMGVQGPVCCQMSLVPVPDTHSPPLVSHTAPCPSALKGWKSLCFGVVWESSCMLLCQCRKSTPTISVPFCALGSPFPPEWNLKHLFWVPLLTQPLSFSQ